jgi:hypothetical protein
MDEEKPNPNIEAPQLRLVQEPGIALTGFIALEIALLFVTVIFIGVFK